VHLHLCPAIPAGQYGQEERPPVPQVKQSPAVSSRWSLVKCARARVCNPRVCRRRSG
jgi:hypothetical protein